MKNISHPESLVKDELLYLSRISEQSGCYKDMLVYLKIYISKTLQDLTGEEKKMLSTAYKNLVGPLRVSWKTLESIGTKEFKRKSYVKYNAIESYKSEIASEIARSCTDLLNLIDHSLIPKATSSESLVFYNRLKGDYYRYISEVSQENIKASTISNSESFYNAANNISEELSNTNPIKLTLHLNSAVFYYEIMKNPEKACEIARNSVEKAELEMDNVSEENLEEVSIILEILK